MNYIMFKVFYHDTRAMIEPNDRGVLDAVLDCLSPIAPVYLREGVVLMRKDCWGANGPHNWLSGLPAVKLCFYYTLLASKI